MIKLEEYLRLCDEESLIKIKSFKKVEEPKISIITPVLNKKNTIKRYLKSIQNQNFQNLEIIFIDDKSDDDSIKIIEELQKEDERIILIKNKKRKGTLISRKLGVYKSKGEYLLFVDPDDIISENILNYTYKLAKKFDFDFIRYNIYIGNFKLNLAGIVCKIQNKLLYKPYIFLYLFYGFGRLLQLDYYITNKLIKKKLFIKALNSIDKFYLEQFMVDCEDGLVNFMIYKLSKSMYFTRKIGYYYIITKKSITNDETGDFKNRLKSNFLYFNFIFKATKNNNIEKEIANNIFYKVYIRRPEIIINLLKDLSDDHEFYLKTINLFLNNDFIPLNSKTILQEMREAIKPSAII